MQYKPLVRISNLYFRQHRIRNILHEERQHTLDSSVFLQSFLTSMRPFHSANVKCRRCCSVPYHASNETYASYIKQCIWLNRSVSNENRRPMIQTVVHLPMACTFQLPSLQARCRSPKAPAPRSVSLSLSVLVQTDSTIAAPVNQRFSFMDVSWLLDTRKGAVKNEIIIFFLACKGLSNDYVGVARGTVL